MIKIFTLLVTLFIFGCSNSTNNNKEIWVYTSLYKDTIAKLKPILNEKFPGVSFKFYQAGSEEIAAKVNAEILTNNLQADILISSDRFWYEELADNKALGEIPTDVFSKVPEQLKHPKKVM